MYTANEKGRPVFISQAQGSATWGASTLGSVPDSEASSLSPAQIVHPSGQRTKGRPQIDSGGPTMGRHVTERALPSLPRGASPPAMSTLGNDEFVDRILELVVRRIDRTPSSPRESNTRVVNIGGIAGPNLQDVHQLPPYPEDVSF